MNDRILELLIKENQAWDDMITRQSKEIPHLEKMLFGIVQRKNVMGLEFINTIKCLSVAIEEQGSSIISIKEDLVKQQYCLEKELKIKSKGYELNILVTQNILRERIRTIEKKFLDLKSNFLNYHASVF